MATPTKTIWKLEPHTRAKHEILRRYLQAWTPILSLAEHPHLLYIDGFAGPGVYDGGEDGSPVIALKAALEHRDLIKAKLFFLFIEKDTTRAQRLKQILDGIDRPDNFRVRVEEGRSFAEGFSDVLKHYQSKSQNLPPTFAFIDPFGWAGVPLSLIKKILSFPRCEVLVNFMYEEINRFLGHPDQEKNLDGLFGTTSWRGLTSVQGKVERRTAIHGLYRDQLQQAAKYVRSFEMRNKHDSTDYFLFFATQNIKGLMKMKEAMWKVDESGEFVFSDATNPLQSQLFGEPDLGVLEKLLRSRFAGQEAHLREVERFVVEETPFRETHYKKVLAALEKDALLELRDPPPRRRKGTFSSSDFLLRFK